MEGASQVLADPHSILSDDHHTAVADSVESELLNLGLYSIGVKSLADPYLFRNGNISHIQAFLSPPGNFSSSLRFSSLGSVWFLRMC